MGNTDNKYLLGTIIGILQEFVADIIYINLALDDKIINRVAILQKLSRSLLLPIHNLLNLNMINIRITFLLYGVCIEDICQLLKPYSEKKFGVARFLSNYDYNRKDEVIKIYKMYNVFKHSKGIIDKNELSGEYLIKNYSMTDREDLSLNKDKIYLIDYHANVYKGLENLILLFRDVDQISLLNPIENIKISADDNVEICKELMKRSRYIVEERK